MAKEEPIAMSDSKGGGDGSVFPIVGPNLPRWQCQICRHSLSFVGVDSYVDKFPGNDFSSSRSAMQGSSMLVGNSVLGSTRMDSSFVVLPKQKSALSQGTSSRPPDASHPGKHSMEDSFVVVFKSEPTSDGVGASMQSLEGGPNDQLLSNTAGFHSTITVLKRAFDIATTQTQVEQPLCLDCMRVLSDKLDKEVEDVNRDIEAYEACLQRLEEETRNAPSEAEFFEEKMKMEEEEKLLEESIKETEKQYKQVTDELKELELKSRKFKELEERYWHEFNNFQFQLISHQEERNTILAKIEVSQAHLEVLKQTNVLNDAFPIYHDGEFGTINNFRLGRLPKIPVEWDEINAAWGQACLLLHTMCQYFKPKFPYRTKMVPMGSYPRIMDCHGSVYDLFGPVNLFWSTRYDKAMTLYLSCLKDFADFANQRDQENNIPPEKRFKLPYKIENDKVENHSITQSFNKQENWTKALKYTLCNLKWALYWFIGNTNFQPLGGMVSSRVEGSLVSSMNSKKSSDSMMGSRLI